jgi:mannose-1-phosphate guanylyltransferase
MSLLSKTYARGLACDDVKEILTITNRDYYFQSKDAWYEAEQGDIAARFMLEPQGRNTAPAILLGALKIRAIYGDDAVMLVMPADHLINDTESFVTDVGEAVTLASKGYLVTFGIRPDRPETGFGYIATGPSIQDSSHCEVAAFIEKPDISKATEYVEKGGYYWNSGIFCFRVGDLLSAFEQHAPDMLASGNACWEVTACNMTDAYCEIDASTFEKIENLSIDYALMEKASNIAVVASNYDWTDVGSWRALAELTAPDDQGNHSVGEVLHFGSKNCYVQSEDRLVATIGLEDVVIVDTPDALLVSDRNNTQRVKEVVEKLRQIGHESYRLHRTISRPWGTYTVLEEGGLYKIKRIEVKPGASLSLQMHHHRSEHWIVVRGMAQVTNGDQELFVRQNESTYIPAGHRHRLENPGIVDLVMIEVQSGEYLGEDDIVRFDDQYGRAENEE